MDGKVNDLHRQLYDELPVGVILVSHDEEERILYHNKAMLEALQCASDEDFHRCTSDCFAGLYHDEGSASVQDLVYSSAHLNNDQVFCSFVTRTALGHLRRLECVTRKGDEVGRDCWLIVIVNASDRNEQLGLSQKITKLQSADIFFTKALEIAKEDKAKGEFGVHVPIYFNLTNFKRYNELFGYEKGNRLLDEIAYIIIEELPEAYVTHMDADNFLALAKKDDLTARLEQVCHRVNNFIHENDITLKVGIRYFHKDASLNELKASFDDAGIACATIKHEPRQMWAVYNEKMKKQALLRRYVITHFEEALRNHQIAVYYQPIIRTLSHKVCGLEALARWQNDTYGLIMPDDFVPILEEAHLIDRLDRYIVKAVIEDLQKQMKEGPIVPVSINFSHYDFDILDMVHLLDEYASQYHIPRDYLRVEISEKGLGKDNRQTRETIEQLRAKSYHVSIDNFGKGFASLELLKRYKFDEIKLDMEFMSCFDEETKNILSSLVSLAKKMKIHIVAEGVETQPQHDFLVNIGCEKIQGYYYCEPLHFDDLKAYGQAHHLEYETALDAQIYDQAGLISMTEMATAIYYSDGQKAYLLAMNDFYRAALDAAQWDQLKDPHYVIDYQHFLPGHGFSEFIREAGLSNEMMDLTFLKNNVFYLLQVKRIAGPLDHQIFMTHLYGIEDRGDVFSAHHELMNYMMSKSLRLFVGVFFLDYKRDRFVTVRSHFHQDIKIEESNASIDDTLERIAAQYVYKDDRRRFLRFMQKEHIIRETKASATEEVIMYFRLCAPDGSYKWYGIFLQYDESHDTTNVYVVLDTWRRQVSFAEVEQYYNETYHLKKLDDYEDIKLNKGEMFDDLIESIRLPVYWKNERLEYEGANYEFLKLHGLNDAQLMLGQTDAQLGWRIDETHSAAIEHTIIEEGRVFYDLHSTINANGYPAVITEAKFPYYSHGQIKGLIGIYSDDDDINHIRKDIEMTKVVDPETKFLTYRAFLGTLEKFDDSYRRYGEDYLVVILEVNDFVRYAQNYGEEIRAKLLARIVTIVSQIFYPKAYYGRIGEGRFMVASKQTDIGAMRKLMLKVMKDVYDIHEIDGCLVDMNADFSYCKGSESEDLDHLLRMLNERLSHAQRQHTGDAVFQGNAVLITLEQLDDAQDRVIIMNQENCEIAYMNKASLSDSHLPLNYDYRHQTCYKLLYGRSLPCEDCDMVRLSAQTFSTRKYRNLNTGIDYVSHSTLIPWMGEDYRFTVAINLSEYMEDNQANKDLLYNEINANDAIRLAIEETDPEIGIQKMIDRIARNLEAERFFIFEENDDDTVSCSYEWERDPNVSLKPKLQRIPKARLQHLYEQFERNEVVLVPNGEKYLLDHPGVNYLIDGIKSAVSGYLRNSERSYGFTEVINPSPKTFKSATELLTTLTWFLTLLLRNRDNLKEMQRLTNEDQLTGVLNRRGFEKAIVGIPEGTTILAIFADINGLKLMNDTYGHKEGDALIKRATQVMSDIFGKDHVFRMGGDEFLIYKEITSEKEADHYLSLLKASSAYHQVSLAIGSTITTAPVEDINAFIKVIDAKMYEDKGRHYHRRSTDRQKA